MPRAFLFVLSMTAFLSAGGCNRPTVVAPRNVSNTPTWTKYTSPDKRVQFEHLADMRINERPRKDDDAPHLALEAATTDGDVQITLVLRVSDQPMPKYCEEMIHACVDRNTLAITEQKKVSLGNGVGWRQEFREGKGSAALDYIAVALEHKSTYIHFTSGAGLARKSELWPICERMVNSLTIGE